MNFVGMESYFLLCFLMLVIWTYQTGRKNICGFLCGLLILIRYEMVFLALLLVLLDFINDRKPPYWILSGLAPVLIWCAYAMVVFGSPIPLSASAKLLAPRIPFVVGWAAYWYLILDEIRASIVILLFSVMGIFSILLLRRLDREYRIVALFSIVYIIVASISAGSFPWYYAPLMPGFAITILAGVNFISSTPGFLTAKIRNEKKQTWITGIRFASFFILLLIQFAFWGKDYILNQGRVGDNRYTAYKQVSDWLNQHATDEQSIASFEIGYVGYFTDMVVIDLAGLVTPGLFAWVDEGVDESLYHALRQYSPDFLLIPIDKTNQIRIVEESQLYRKIDSFTDKYFLFGKLWRGRAELSRNDVFCRSPAHRNCQDRNYDQKD
jgi:hypothetical protein